MPLIGEWSMAMVMPGEETPDEVPDVGGRVTFEWMGDKAWEMARDHKTWEKDFNRIYTRVD